MSHAFHAISSFSDDEDDDVVMVHSPSQTSASANSTGTGPAAPHGPRPKQYVDLTALHSPTQQRARLTGPFLSPTASSREPAPPLQQELQQSAFASAPARALQQAYANDNSENTYQQPLRAPIHGQTGLLRPAVAAPTPGPNFKRFRPQAHVQGGPGGRPLLTPQQPQPQQQQPQQQLQQQPMQRLQQQQQ